MKDNGQKRLYCASFKAMALTAIGNGAGIKETARAYGVRRGTLSLWCKQAGMPSRMQLTSLQREMCQDYLDNDLSQKETAIKYGVSLGALQRYLQVYRGVASNVISQTNADGVKSYTKVTEAPVKIETAATYNNIDNKGLLHAIAATERWRTE